MRSVRSILPVMGAVLGVGVAGLYVLDRGLVFLASPQLNHFSGAPLGGDFWQFWVSARLALLGLAQGAYWPEMVTSAFADLVDSVNPGVLSRALYYPPTLLLFLAPFGALPFFVAYLAFFFTTLGVLLAAVWRWVPERRVLLMMLGFCGIWVNLICGQNGLLTAGLFGFSMFFLPVSPVLSGLFLGLLTIKPQLGLLIPFALIAGREWAVLKAAVVATFGLVGVSILFFGVLIWGDAVVGMLTASTVLGDSFDLLVRNPSFFSFFRLSGLDVAAHVAWFGPMWGTAGVALVLHACCALPVAGSVLWVWRRTENNRLRTAALACGAVLVTPFLYDYDQTWLIWPILLLGLEAARTRWTWGEVALLPPAMLWPIAGGALSRLIHVQVGFVMPLLLLGLVLVRTRRELRGGVSGVAPGPSSALHPGA